MKTNSKICIVLGNLTYEKAIQAIETISFAEIRMDLLNYTYQQYQNIFAKLTNSIATYRDSVDTQTVEQNYTTAIKYVCSYIDLDIELPENLRLKLIEKARNSGCKVILSYHNYTNTPTLQELTKIINNLFTKGADVVKITCMANDQADCSRVLGLYENYKNLVAFCMGKLGLITRLAAPIVGAPYTYASILDTEIAPGLPSYSLVNDFLDKYNVD
ncbi:MAG TPA: type I 3-dehydroquinate dehydratase [Salinivirgaceae bacterium]|nr:type I 3-dehydroquinate dehydratase [Salinivirgaceae bacterium]